ncbi:MAG: YkgJ family cysteine cluster protein [Xanthomonadales bacterium]|nr:YkgJ family cysteine cluster protein [Xanthomonadales bacterium]
MGHPCLSCGACCAFFRVAFHWSESDDFAGGTTPSSLTEKLDPHRLVMRGTQARTPHCIALRGVVGEQAHCGIYAQRPSPCHDLIPAWESGHPSPQCDRARIAHGLPPLEPMSWIAMPTAFAADSSAAFVTLIAADNRIPLEMAAIRGAEETGGSGG